MQVNRDVVIDLLPVYFSGEASESTRALVEECFREDPDLERIARSASKDVEVLRGAQVGQEEWEKKLALELGRERARVRAESVHAVCASTALMFTLTSMAFRIHHHKLILLNWQKYPLTGAAFAVGAAICWLAFWLGRTRFRILPKLLRTKNWGLYFTTCLCVFAGINLVQWTLGQADVVSPWMTVLLAAAAGMTWIRYLMERRKEPAAD
jgi:hypothetical protein